MELPSQDHPKLSFHAVHEGQVAPLVKTWRRFRSIDAARRAGLQIQKRKKKKKNSDNLVSIWKQTDDVVQYGPKGTTCAPVWTGIGDTMTCSDKICKWNVLGVSGSVLSGLLCPTYLTSITIGRKFNFAHCRRGLCCRAERYATDTVHHPILMETRVPLDDGKLVEEDQCADFSDAKCMSWVRGDEDVTVLDGFTGTALRRDGTDDTAPATVSGACLSALRQDVTSRLKANDRRRVQRLTREYESRKVQLLEKHPLFVDGYMSEKTSRSVVETSPARRRRRSIDVVDKMLRARLLKIPSDDNATTYARDPSPKLQVNAHAARKRLMFR